MVPKIVNVRAGLGVQKNISTVEIEDVQVNANL